MAPLALFDLRHHPRQSSYLSTNVLRGYESDFSKTKRGRLCWLVRVGRCSL
jgi:hypothetical protein